MNFIQSILIANRGEIALRIIRTCRKMGIRSIAVFSDADREAPFTKAADLAVHIGNSPPQESYLRQDHLIEVAKKTHADAIHPGYGFLSENAAFAAACQAAGLIFIGPNPNAIAQMASKTAAKALMKAHEVPVIPGYQGMEQSAEKMIQEAERIGYPVLLKASAGGGGKGMRLVEKAADLPAALDAAQREAQQAFGDPKLLLEKYISSGRHIEFQVFGDQHGTVIHLFERECTIQRRYQKVIEESPSPIMDEALRGEMAQAAIQAAKALQYDNAGTVEFIFDEATRAFYFLEVNTRLQVEHPVTEAITGLDLVRMQIESAQGLPLPINQEEVKARGYAIEVRLYAEDAQNQFLPVTGLIKRFEWPEIEGLRVDTGIERGSRISIFYDPMIAKLIVWDLDRLQALRKMRYVLSQLRCMGMTTNQHFLLQILQHQAFQQGQYDTHFIEQHLDLLLSSEGILAYSHYACLATCLFHWQDRQGSRSLLRTLPSGWRNSFYRPQLCEYAIGEQEYQVSYRYLKSHFEMAVDEQAYRVQLEAVDDQMIRLDIDGLVYTFQLAVGEQCLYLHQELMGNFCVQTVDRFPAPKSEAAAGVLEAPMPSQVVKVLVEAGQKVEKGEALIVLSSMKMENSICAVSSGTIEAVYAKEGSNIEAGFL
ncbi:MAG: biotin carboxylase N-terminal domain-containing protein, partial [Bacteroidota bacterium]